MSENPNDNNEQKTRPVGESWQEVGRQFEALGLSLAHAFRSAWSSIETNTEAQQVKSSMENVFREVGRAIEDTAKAPEGEKVKEEAKRAAEKLRDAGEKTVEKARPEIIAALKKVNEELKRAIDKMDSEK